MSIPLENSDLNVAEQVNVLFKSAMGFPSTKESTPWFQETAVKYNNYLNGEELLLDTIPSSPSWGSNKQASDVGLTSNDFATGGYVRDDSTGTIREYKRVILTATPNSSNNSYYLLDSNGNNILADGLQFNTKWSGVGDKIYPYTLNTENQIEADPNAPDELLQDSTGGNWLFDIKNGVLFFPDYSSSLCNNTTNKPVFSFFKYIGRKGISNLDIGGGGSGSGSGNGIDISGGSTASDISMNFSQNRNEGDIVYDSDRNIFLEASRSKDDENSQYTEDEINFRPLGYSFFRENLEGQPPSPLFFFFDITPSSITINWTNPRQYPSGVSNSSDQHDAANGELSATVNSNGNIFFPVVNRIMIQIKNLQTGSYEGWGTERSPISQNVEGLTGGYVICSKNHPIPPMKTGVSPYFGTRHSIGRHSKVYELIDMANSIVLYSVGNTPSTDPVIKTNIDNNPKRVSGINGETNKEINPSTAGYEIKVWLENQYNKTGGMTENDFNVMTLTKDNNNNILNFQNVSPPTEPIDLSLNLAFNDLYSKNVGNGNTVIELIVKDPKQTTSSGDFNTTINLVGVKLEYANTETNSPYESDWTNVKKIYFKNNTQITSSSSLGTTLTAQFFDGINGIHKINRLNDHGAITDADTNTKYYYYIKLNSEFLSVTNNQFKQYHSFRISYKNASNDNFGTTTISNIVSVKEPQKPSIESVKMTDYNKIRITMATYGGDKEDFILGETADTDINKNYAVYLREILFRIKYKYNGQSDFTEIETFTVSGSNNNNSTGNTDSAYVTTESYSSNSYDYTIPAGFFENSGETLLTTPITYQFESKFKNNLFGADYSVFSDPETITITKPNSNITLTLTPLTSGTNNNNKIQATWTAPSNGNRGIVSVQANNGLPKLHKYTFKSALLKEVNDDNGVTHDNTIITSTRNADPNTNLMFTFYDILKKTDSDISSNKDLDLTIREYNEYINDYSEASRTISATATKPEVVSINSHTNLSISKSTTNKNKVTLNWDHPDIRGLTIGGNNIRNTILTYTIDISRNETTNKYLIENNNHTDQTYQTITTRSDNTNDKIGTTDAANSITLTSENDGSLLWPDSTYNYTVRATNSLGYQSDIQTFVATFITEAPTIPDAFNYFISTRLNTLRTNKVYNLKNNNNYTNLGVLVSNGISSTTNYSGTAVQITNYNSLSDITSNQITHVLNKKDLQNFSSQLSNTIVQQWSSEVPTTANQAGFKIVNAADSDSVLYTIGMSDNYTTESGDSTLFEVLRTNRKDIYSENYDNRNKGYWLKESIQYKINLASKSNLNNYLYKPLKFELKSYYNSNGSDSNISETQNGETIILQNTYSTNTDGNDGNVYFDSLNSNPAIGKNNNEDDMITYTPENQINGIPNLARGGTIILDYKLSNYSEYYLLQNTKNVAEHYFSYKTNNANSVINWSSKDGGTRNSDHWIISKTLSSIPDTNSATKGITIKISAKNTKGTTDLIIGSGESTVYNFIYDKPSSNLINQNGINIMEVPSGFNPDYNETYAKTTSTYSNFSSTGSDKNNNQLNLWNGYFYSRNGWQSATSINTTNCADYGMSSSDPVFSGEDNDYKYVIFKYTRNMPDGNANRIICALKGSSSSNDPEININDLLHDNVSVYLYTGTAMTEHYWLNISKGNTALTLVDAYNQAITYVGNLGDGIYTDGSKGIDNTTFINSSGLSTNFTNSSALGGSMPRRVIGAYINRLDFSAGNVLTFYIAIKIKNNINKRIVKPDLYLSGDNTQGKTYKFN